MTLTQLRIFVTVAELGHVTRAADKLGITQAAASAAISVLERQYAIKLFNRVGRRVVISDAGARFLGTAQELTERARAAERRLRELAGETVGHIEIAASQTIANYWLPRRLATFHERYPGIALNVSISNTREVEAAIVTGAADIGFVEGTVQSSDLLVEEVDHDQLVLVVASRQAPLLGDPSDTRDLTSMRWVVREPGSGTREALEQLAAKANVSWGDLTIALELPSNEAVREAVEAGTGVSLISEHVVTSSLASGALRALPLDIPPRGFAMVRRSNEPASEAAVALSDMIREKRPQAVQAD